MGRQGLAQVAYLCTAEMEEQWELYKWKEPVTPCGPQVADLCTSEMEEPWELCELEELITPCGAQVAYLCISEMEEQWKLYNWKEAADAVWCAGWIAVPKKRRSSGSCTGW